LKNQFSIGLRPKKTKTFIEKSIFNRKKQRFSLKILFSIGLKPKNKHFHGKNKAGSKNIVNSNGKRAQHRLPQCLRPKKQRFSLKNPFSIGLRPKKQRLSLKN